jgi:Transposase and inactivated derivatives
MKNICDEHVKQTIVTEYQKGKSATALCKEHNIPRSTLYHWIKQYHPLKTVTDTTIYYQEYLELKRHADKLETQVAIMKAAGCGTAAPLQEKLAAMERLHSQYSVHALCDTMDVARGTFYNHIFRRTDVTQNDKRREVMREHIRNAFDDSQQRYGARKICAKLREQGIGTTERYVTELMREMNLYSMNVNAKREHKMYESKTRKRNVLQRQFHAAEPNRAWVSDVTTFKYKTRYYYICTIIDLFSRKVVGHRVSKANSTFLVTSTFKRAYKLRNQPQALIFHSDQGSQYTSLYFQKLLQMNKVVQSFSKSGSPHDNAVAEAFFSALKKEELYRRNYRSEQEFFSGVEDYIRFYNAERPHSTVFYKTPNQFETDYENTKKDIS